MAHCGLCRAVPGCPLESDRQSPGAGSPRADIGPHRATPFKANTELLMERLFLIDAYALIFRAYYAFIGRPMRNSEGLNTSAIFGFVKFLRDLIRREEPRLLGVAFDPKGGNFRHEIYPQYKANREATPEDIIAAVPYIKRVLEAMRIPVIEVPGYEADDVIGTLSMKAAGAGYEVYMVTPDKDYGQLIRPTVRIYKQRKGGDGIEVIGCEQIREHYGIDDPCRVIDILALWGDASDNIPGVPGIGEKSAIKLVCEFGTVENLLENTDKLKGKQRENIEALREQILLAKRLATIELNVPVEFDPAGLTMENPDLEMLADVYRELGFRSFLNELQGNPFVTAAEGVAGTASGAGRGSAGQVAAHASGITDTGGIAGGAGSVGIAGTVAAAGGSGGAGTTGMPGASDGRRAGVAGSRASGNAVQDASQGSLFDAFGQVPDAGAAFPGAGDLTPSGSVSEPYAGNSPAGQRDLFAGPGEVSGVGGMVQHDPNRDTANAGAAGDRVTSAGGLFGQQYQTIDTVPHTYHTVTEPAELEALAARLAACEAFCFDTETTGFDVFGDRLVGISVAIEPHEAWYIPCNRENTDRVVAALRPVFADEKIAKIGQNIKFDLMVLRRLGITIRGRMYDTMILHYLLDPESRHNMNALAEKYLNYKPIEIETLIGKGSKQLTMDLVNVERVKEYAAEDADVTLQLKQALYPMIEQIGLQHLYFEIEEPMIAVLADIEMAGVRIDSEALAVYAVELNRKLAELEAAIRTEAGEPNLNINSARQLGEVLFGKMRIAEKPKMTKTKQLLHRRGLPPVVRPQTPDRRSDPRIPGREETAFDLCRGAAPAGQPLDGAHPHLVQPGRDGHGTPFVDESQFAEHPDPRRPRPPHPQGVHPVVRRPPAAFSRLLPGRTAADGAPVRRRGDDRGVRARRGHPYRDGGHAVPNGQRGDLRRTPPGQNGQFRNHLRHFGVRIGPTVRTFRARKPRRSSTAISSRTPGSRSIWTTWSRRPRRRVSSRRFSAAAAT